MAHSQRNCAIVHKGAVALYDQGFGKFHEILPKVAEKLLAKLPMILNSDRDAICVALKTSNRITPETGNIVGINNTQEVHRVQVSPGLLPVVEASDRLSQAGAAKAIEFDEYGLLI